MSNYSLQDLVRPLTAEEIRTAIYALVAKRGVVTTNWQPFAPTKVLIHVVSIVLAAFSVLVSSIAAGGFLGLASRSWAVLIARYRYGITSIQEKSLATCTVQLTNTGTGVYSAGPNEWTFFNPGTRARYVNSEPFAFGIGGSATFLVTSVEAGSIATSDIGGITAIESPSVQGVTCTNITPAVGLEDASLSEIVATCLAKRDSSSSFGPKGAYVWAAMSATRPDGSSIGVTRVRSFARGDRTVRVFVASQTGPVSGVLTDAASDISIVFRAIRDNAEPANITAEVYSATASAMPLAYEAWLTADGGSLTSLPGGTLDEKVRLRVLTDVAAFLAQAPIGGYNADETNRVYREAIAAVITKSVPAIYRVRLIEPAGDFLLGAGQFPVLGAVSQADIHVTSRLGVA